MKFRAWGVSLLTVASVLAVLPRKAPSEDQLRAQPTLGELMALPYEEVPKPETPEILSNSDVNDAIARADACDRGTQLLASYKEAEPAGGVALRNAAASVVLVSIGARGTRNPARVGTGVVVDSAGDVLTNYHLLRGETTGVIFAKPASGAMARNGAGYGFRIIAQDQSADLALLRVDNLPRSLALIQMGDADPAQTAISVIAHLPNQLWAYQSATTAGTVRANFQWTDVDGARHTANVLQMKTAAPLGGAGGVALNDRGQLLGIVTTAGGQTGDYIAVAADSIQSFLSKAAAATAQSDATASTGSIPPAVKYFSAYFPDGRMALKVVFADLDEYMISDRERNTLEMMAVAKDGAMVSAKIPNSEEGSTQWTITLPDKTVVNAQGQGAIPDQFSEQ